MIETPSDRNFSCFACSGFHTKDLSANCENCSKPMAVGQRLVGTRIAGFKLLEYKSRGYYGLTFKCENSIGKVFAIKLIPKALYENRSKSFDEEISKYVLLGNHSNIAEIQDAGTGSVSCLDQQVEVYYIVMEWVAGETLRSYIATKPLTASDVYTICAQMASALSRFESRGLEHGDLNADNVMIQSITNDELGSQLTRSPLRVKIIDTGSAVFAGQKSKKTVSDLNYLGSHATSLTNAARAHDPQLPLDDEAFLNGVDAFTGLLRDESNQRGFASADAFIERLREKYDQRRFYHIETNEILNSPFEYINALDFKPNSTLLPKLFHNDFPWIRDSIMSPSQQVLITGPRGCGKTMILKNMGLRTRLLAANKPANPESFSLIMENEDCVGLFVSARIEIGNQLFIAKLPPWATVDENIICYFQLLYALEAADTLLMIQSHFQVEFDQQSEFEFCSLLSDALGKNCGSLAEALGALRRALIEIRQSKFSLIDASALTSGGFLRQLCERFVNLHPAFNGKVVNFLLDDFSLPKIPSHIQKVLLPLIWAPGEGYFFKVSAHSKSMEQVDLRGNQYDEQRDFKEVNLGREYFNFTSSAQGKASAQQTITSIIERRYSHSSQYGGQKVDLEAILGKGSTSIAADLAQLAQHKKTRSYNYHGWETILSLCSGEISYVLDIVGRIIESQGPYGPFPIPEAVQNKTIRDHAKNELVQLQDHVTSHTNLYAVAQAFGELSRAKLVGKKVKDGSRDRFAEYTRIEVELSGKTQKARDALVELVSNGVFIDGGLSSSSSGKPTQKLLFRRLFTPAFPTTWNNRDGFNWTEQRFAKFVEDPSAFVKTEMRNGSKKAGATPLLDTEDEVRS